MPTSYYENTHSIPSPVLEAARLVVNHAKMAGWEDQWQLLGIASRNCIPQPLSSRMQNERQPKQPAGQEAYDFDKKAEEVAKERGQIVVYPEPNQIQIDLDTQEEYQEFCERVRQLLDPYEGDWTKEEHFSKSGKPHRHITITFPGRAPFTEWERIALQWALGSDPMREFLNTKRLLFNQTERPTRLFEVPDDSTLHQSIQMNQQDF